MPFPKKIKSFDFSTLEMDINAQDNLKSLANRLSDKCWSHQDVAIAMSDEERQLVKTFKQNLKDYLFTIGQGRYCCFCGMELSTNKSTYDLDHLISKINKKRLIFDLRNLALSCKPCNQSKSTKKVTAGKINEEEDILHDGENDYILVHPHFNDWDKHLFIDKYQRIIAHDIKGKQTIIICGINVKNAMWLADHFVVLKPTVKAHNDWINFYSALANEDNNAKKTKYKKFLRKLLDMATDPAATELLQVLAPLLEEN